MMGDKDGPVSRYNLAYFHLQADHFVQCFDARTILKPKTQMDLFEVKDLEMRDTVVIECSIAHMWNITKKKAKPSWYSFLQLQAIFLIHQDVCAAQEDTEVRQAPKYENLSL